jgi:hypothetical protein
MPLPAGFERVGCGIVHRDLRLHSTDSACLVDTCPGEGIALAAQAFVIEITVQIIAHYFGPYFCEQVACRAGDAEISIGFGGIWIAL